MSLTTGRERAAIGFRVKSGWAAAVLVAGPIDAPQVLETSVVELSDPRAPNSRQPYHAAMGVARKDGPTLQRLLASVDAHAQQSIAALVGGYHAAGHRLAGAGIVVGSDSDPAGIANPHIRAHAAEGRLFRTAVEHALERCGVPYSTFVERRLFAHAAQVFRRPEPELKRAVAQLRRAGGGRWRADEKAAALAAWLLLSSRQPSRKGRGRTTVWRR